MYKSTENNLSRSLKSAIALLALTFAGATNAAIPEKGMWWNPNESGRGYGIDVQDNILFVTYYGYDEAGKSTFFTSLGALTSTGEEWISADWNGFSGGQCWGCSYSAPTPTSIGAARFKFDTPLTGTITLSNGTSIQIQRQSVVGFNPAHALQGTWHTTNGTRGSYFGDMLWINRVLAGNDSKFSGVIVGGSAARILVGGPVEDGDPYTASILIDSSTNYYKFMLFK